MDKWVKVLGTECREMVKVARDSQLFYLSIVSDASRNVAQGDGHGRRASASPYQTLPPCQFNPSPSISNSFMHVLLHPILPSYNWPSSSPRIHNLTHIHFLYFFFTNSSLFFLSIYPNHLNVLLFTHSTTPHFTPFAQVPCHTFHACFHCFHLPIVSRHMLLSDNSFPQHALLTTVPFSISKSLIHTSDSTLDY